MDAVRVKTLHQLHPIVQHEKGIEITAQSLHLPCHRLHLFVRSILHPKLNPTATAFKGYTRRVEVTDCIGKMGYKLYLKHVAPFLH